MLHRGLRRHFAFLAAANAIGQDEEPSVRARVRGRGWSYVPEIVLIVLPLLSRVGKISELHIQGQWMPAEHRCQAHRK